MSDGDRGLVLHSSWTGIVTSLLGAVLLVLLAVVALATAGVTVVSVVLTILAVGLLAVVLFDMPISSEFDAEGVTRRALLRHHRVQWDDVDRLSRARRGMFRSTKMAPTGGLIAARGRRNYTLVDRMEGFQEHDALRRTLGDAGERLGIDRIAKPPLEQPPTWLRRRARWAPTSPGDR